MQEEKLSEGQKYILEFMKGLADLYRQGGKERVIEYMEHMKKMNAR